MAERKLTKEQIANINGYSDKIVSLNGVIESVRENIGMFVGGGGNKGAITIIREIFQNAFDQMIRITSCGTSSGVSYNEITNECTVWDDGNGIPFDSIIRVFTKEYTSSNYSKADYDFTSGRHGIGSKACLALSEYFIVQSFNAKEVTKSGKAEAVECHFYDGIPDKRGIFKIPNPDNRQGTVIRFKPSVKYLGKFDVKCEKVINLVEKIMPLSNPNNFCVFNGTKLNGENFSRTITNKDGITTYVVLAANKPLIKPIVISNMLPDKKIDISMTFDTGSLSGDEELMSFANYSPTPIGSHVDGFMEGVVGFFRPYMNNVYLNGNKNKDLKITPKDIKSSLVAAIHACLLKPTFGGQAKESLENPEIIPYIKQVIIDGLTEWSKTNPQDLAKVCKFIKELAEIRLKAEKGKTKLSDSFTKSATSTLPSKYVRPTGKKNLELILAEGNSASGGFENNRDNEVVGIFPLRGKIANAFTTKKSEFRLNAEVASIITILDSGFGKDFDIDKCMFDKVIIATDAKHIGYLYGDM